MHQDVIRIETAIRISAKESGIALVGYSPMTKQTYLRRDCAQYLLGKGYNRAITLAYPISASACELLFKRKDEGGSCSTSPNM